MRPVSSWSPTATWLLLLLSTPVSAFYPYIPPWEGSSDSTDERRAAPVPGPADALPADSVHVILPLHRTPVRRENKYSIKTAQTPTQTDSVGVDQDGMDYTYFSTMTFGTSDIKYHMLMDTAASNTWVMSSECKTSVCNSHNTLGTAESSSLKLGTETFSITYGTGSVNGTIATDIAHFAGKSINLTFGLASGVSSEFANYALDGILGFGRGTSDQGGVEAPSIIDVLASNSLIKSKLIGIHLSRTADAKNDGEMNLGAPNPNRYDGDLAYIPVVDNERGFWEIALDDAGFDGKLGSIKGQTAIVDTGTSFMLIPPASAKTLHALISGSKQSGESYTVPCTSTQPLQLVFGGKTYDISSKDYVGTSAGDGACHSNIIGRQTFGSNQWLIGDVFLKNVYTVFDFDGKRIGFGVKSEETTSSTVQTSSAPSTTPSSVPTTSVPVPLTPVGSTLATSTPTASESGASAAQTQSDLPSKSYASSSASVPLLTLALPLLLALHHLAALYK